MRRGGAPSGAASAPSRVTALGDRTGVLAGAGAYALWGVFPLFFVLLQPAGPIEVLAHRVVWSLAVCAVVVTLLRGWPVLLRVLRNPAQLALLAVAAVVIAVNWGVYIYAVHIGHVLEASLGYFINPLVTVLFGVLLLGERLRPWQWAAVGTGAVAVVVLTVAHGRLPWIALVLAFSFAVYGLVKNRVGRRGGGVDALSSLSVETMLLFLPAAVTLAVLGASGQATFTGHGAGHGALLAATGLVTAVPLLLFAVAARRVPLTTIGLLQYGAPVLQFVCGLLLGETMPAARWAGFGLVWVALVVLTVDTVRGSRQGRGMSQAAVRPVEPVVE
ncbi:chloramphenicol-sensitive protein RarD [Kineococcus xinjiangensis]|uniref:Chloramphenicol-sensitive protein RarD n=1 Tax=Kineococcus xinjiangensis TaxID=512762 RepID=A0A2S6ITK2_9ACTN|nr:EamA family transporter RarD [Kineococcus xinjiangensis]PPK97510.1 chloramphenicol-sensitive protein RarD [Kineococcus xinjiangensis]